MGRVEQAVEDSMTILKVIANSSHVDKLRVAD